MTVNIGSARDAYAGLGKPARQSRFASNGKHLAILVIGLAALTRLPLDRSSQEHAILMMLGLAAVAGLARENQARSRARLIAWDQRRNLRYLRTVKGGTS